jgi:hypothetical protein
MSADRVSLSFLRRAARGARVLAGLLALATALGAVAQVDPGVQRTADFVVYFGIMPAELAQSRLAAHPTPAPAHDAPPFLADTHHVIVAVFDARSGERVTDATVQARHEPGRGVATEKSLVPMPLGDALSYGNTFVVPDGTNHRFVLSIRQGARDARVEFTYDNRHGSVR